MTAATRATLVLASASVVTAAGLLVPVAASAQIDYSNCTALHQDFRHGVAKSYNAALQEHRSTGYPMAAYGRHARRVYWANASGLDRDHDGVDCEA